jgi:very-short-patch-repair endonuclease
MLERNSAADMARSGYLAEQGYKVLRFWNNDVLKNIEGVKAVIHDELASASKRAPHPRPLPTASRGEGSDRRLS